MRYRPGGRDRSRPGLAGIVAIALTLGLPGCQDPSAGPSAAEASPAIVGQPDIRCGRFEGPDCNDLLELGTDAVAGARPDVPLLIAVGSTCPDNARCRPSALGGEEVAVVVVWPDGTSAWATIPLPADWPDGAPGAAVAQVGALPPHLEALVAAGS